MLSYLPNQESNPEPPALQGEALTTLWSPAPRPQVRGLVCTKATEVEPRNKIIFRDHWWALL